MQKTAQKRSIFNKLREALDIPSASVEKFFKPELARVMTDLRQADDNIRTLLTSQRIGTADVDVPGGKSVKDLLKSARSNFNRREYMAGVADLGQFHKRMYEVSRIIDNLRLSVDKIHHNFLFQDLSPEQQENIRSLREHMSSLASYQTPPYFIKEAGVFGDFFHNIVNKRGRSLAIWEKKYPKVAKELREQGSRLIDQAQYLFENTLSNLKAMASARATRSVDNYMAYAEKISSDYKKFDSGDKGFRAYYNNVVKPSLEQQDKIEGIKPSAPEGPSVKVPDAKELGKQEIVPESESETIPVPPKPQIATTMPMSGVEPTQLPTAPIAPTMPVSSEQEQTEPSPPTAMSVPPASPPPARMTPEEMRQFEAQHGFGGSLEAHRKFISSLESLSQEDPKIMASFISKYAKSIQVKYPEQAIELFSIARKLRG